ncbi:MFS transporter [Bacillus licheniformis]|nr:MFS transporter [Bacillus licheniformis]
MLYLRILYDYYLVAILFRNSTRFNRRKYCLCCITCSMGSNSRFIIFSWLSDKLGRRKPVLLMMLPFGILSTAAIVYFDSLPILYMTLIVYGIVGKLALTRLIAVVANNAPKQSLSTAFGFYNFVGMLGSI